MWYNTMPNLLATVTYYDVLPYIETIFQNNLYVTIFGIIISLVGILLASIGLYVSDRKKLPYYTTRKSKHTEISKEDLEKLGLDSSKYDLKEVSVTKLVFWNAGKEIIDATDITKYEPIKIMTKNDNKILGIKCICSNEKANQFSYCVSEDKSYSSFDFDYVSRGEGVLLQIVHTGTLEDIFMTGKIKGTKKPKYKRVMDIPNVHSFKFLPYIPKPIKKVLGTIFFFYYPIAHSQSLLMSGFNFTNLFIAILLVEIMWGAGVYYLFLSRVPKKLDDLFFEDSLYF